jgi:hypothetical protein
VGGILLLERVTFSPQGTFLRRIHHARLDRISSRSQSSGYILSNITHRNTEFSMSKRILRMFIFALAFCGTAQAADLPARAPDEAPPSAPACFSSLWDYMNSSVRDCPLRFGPITLYGTLDGGYGYELWGTRVGQNADKPNYAIQRNSGNTHWLWSPNGLSTSTIGLRLAQPLADGWEIVGAVEAGFNPYTNPLRC